MSSRRLAHTLRTASRGLLGYPAPATGRCLFTPPPPAPSSSSSSSSSSSPSLILTRSYAAKKKSSKKSKTSAFEEEDEQEVEDVPVIQTKGKKGKGKDPLVVAERVDGYDLKAVEAGMDESIEKLRIGLKGVVGRVGKVTPALLDGVRVEDEDGKRRPLNEFAMVSVKDGKNLLITIYEESLTKSVTKAILNSNLSLNPQPLSPTSLLVPIPLADWAKRQSLVRQASEVCESARIHIRNHRTKGQKEIKSAFSSKEDARAEAKELDERTKKRTEEVDRIFEEAKKVLMDE